MGVAVVQDKVVTLLSHGKASIDQDETQKGIYLSGIKEHRKNLETTFLEIIKS